MHKNGQFEYIRTCNSVKYRSAINLYEYKIMRIGQFWRLLNFMRFLIMRFYCQKDSSYMTRNLLKEQDAEKSGSRTPGRVQRTIDRGINLLLALYDPLLSSFFFFFLSRLLVSKPHTKSMQQRFRLHEHCSTPDLARSTSLVHACEPRKWFWFVRVKQLLVLCPCLHCSTRMTSLKAERPAQVSK